MNFLTSRHSRFQVLAFMLACGLFSARAEMSVTKSGTPAAVPPGGTINYTITLDNTTGATKTNLQLTDTLDSNVTLTGTVNASPVALDDTYTCTGNVNISVVAASGLTANDFLGLGTTGTISAFDAASANGGTVSVTQSGANMGAFTYNPPRGFTGNDTFKYTLTNPAGSNQATVTITVSNMIWFINNTAAAGDGRFSTPYNSLAAFSAVQTGTAPNAKPGDAIYIFQGSGNYTGGLLLLNNQVLLGQGVACDNTNLGFTLSGNSVTLPIAGTAPTIVNGSGNGVTLASNNTLRGFNLGNCSGPAISGSSFGNLLVTSVAINSTGQALSLSTGAANATFTSVTSSGGVNNVVFSAVTGSVAFGTGGALSGASSTNFTSTGGSVTTTFGGTLTRASNGRAVDIQGATGGTMTFSGAVSATANNGTLECVLLNNTGSTVNFSGGLTLSGSTSAALFNAVGGGTVSVTGSNNTISASGGGPALIVTNVTIGSSPMTFKSISASGSTSGIALSNTGTGGLTVSGTGTTAGTGGTIQNTSGRGASFISTGPISLSNMNFTNAGNTNLVDPAFGGGGVSPGEDANANLNANAGIHLANITGVTLTNIVLTGGAQQGINGNNVTNFTLSNSTISNAGNQVREDGLHFKDMLGNSSITNTTFTNNQAVQVHIENYTGAAGSLITFNNVSVQSTGLGAAPNGSHGFLLEAHGTANINFLIQNCTFNNLFSNSIQSGNDGSGLMEITVTGCTFTNVGASGITLAQDGSGGLQFNIHDNGTLASPTFLRGTNTGSSASININQAGNAPPSAVLEGQISNNFIGNGSSPTSANSGGDGINITSVAPGTTTVQVNNNTIQGVGNNGINMIMGEDTASSHTMNLTVFGNSATVTNSPNGFDGIRVNSGTLSTDKGTLRLDMHNNTGSSTPGNDIDLLQRQGTTVQLLNYGGANNVNSQVQTYINTTRVNTASHNTFLISNSVPTGGGFVTTASVPAPNLPSPLLFAAGGVDARAESSAAVPAVDAALESTPAQNVAARQAELPAATTAETLSGVVTKTLAQDELNSTVAAAIQRWSKSGLSSGQIALLNEIKFEVKEMPGWYLGAASNGRATISRDERRVTLSSTAAGHGWYVDSQPLDDSEFSDLKSTTRRFADPRGVPAGRLDLLTTVMHEMGHQLGLADAYRAGDRDSLMYGYLTLGERRLPAKDQAKGATPRLIPPGNGFLFSPINIPSLPAGKTVTVTFSVVVNNPLTPPTTAQVTNQAAVSANAGAFTANSNVVTTTILQPDLTLSKSHSGSFTQGDTNKTYTLTVNNIGGAASSGTVTVSDTLPAGLTPVSCTGTGWNAASIVGQTVTITRSDALPAGQSYPALTLTVNVTQTALSVTNTASVSGGNQVNTANDGASDPTTINPAPVTHFTVATGSTATAGTAFNVTVTALNAFNNPVTNYTGTIHFTKSDAGAGSAVPANYTFVAGDNSVHTFSNGVTLVTSGAQTVSVNDVAIPAATGVSGTITVNPAAATKYVVTGNNTSTAGAQYTLTVTAQDQFNNTATGYLGTVKFTKTDGSASSIVPANYTFVAGDNGVHTFTNGVTLITTPSQTVTATDSVTASITGSKTVTVNPANASTLAVTTPASTTAGVPFSITVTARDAFNNVATGYLGTVNFTKTDAGAGSAVPANYTFVAGDSGAHTFTNGVTLVTAPTKSITATDTVTSTITGLSTITVNPATTSKYLVAAPATATANVAINFTVTAQDAFNNTTPAYAGTVKFTSTDAAATLPANSTLTNGVGTFSATMKTAGNRTITATDSVTAATTGTSGTIVVTAVTNFLVTAPAGATAGSAFTVSVTARDASNATVPGYTGTVHFTSNDGAAVLPADATLTNGTGNFSVTLKTSGSRTVSVNDTVTPAISGASGTIAVSGAAATHYTVSAPASATAGTPFSVTVTALDQFNNIATGYLGTAHFTKSDAGTGSSVPADYTFVAGDNGAHTFAGVTLVTAGSRTVTATDTVTASITGTTAAINVSPGSATKFAVSAPSSVTAGSAFNFTVTAQDAFNNTATAYAGTVHFTSTDGAATLPANSTLTSGTGTFSATLKTFGARTITATDTVTAAITGVSANIAVSAASATHFTVAAPASATAGAPFSITVTALDQFNNTAAGYLGTVKFSKTDAAASSVLPANYTFAAGDNGVHTFTNGVTLITAGSQTVTATDTVTAAITGTSNAITVNAAAATHYAVSAPANATAGSAANFTVTALDTFNNIASAYAGTVHFTSTDAAATLPANSTLTSGTGTFSATLKTAGTQTLTATDTVTTSITGASANISVSAAAATKFALSAPASATAGLAFNFTVTAQDPFNNTATAYAGTVHFTTTDAAATLPANSTLTNGTGSFSATLKTNGSQTLTATDTVTAAITGTSGAITVGPATATHFAVTTPVGATAGTAFNYNVTALDQFSNTATAYAGTVHFTSTDGAAVVPANTTLTSGVGVFSATLKTSGNQTITATDAVTAAITGTSNSIAVSASAATHFTVSAPANATAGAAFSFTVTAQDQFNNTATGYAGTVNFTKSDAAASVPANSTLTNGVGTFSATLRTAGSQTISANDTVSGSIAGTSNAITVSGAAATHFTISPPPTATAGVAYGFVVNALDPFNNTATGYTGTVHFTKSDNAAGSNVSADYTFVAADNGIRSFGNAVTFVTAGMQTITVTDTVTPAITGTSAPVIVSPAAATHFAVSAPAAATAGSAFNFTVTAQDQFNNTATAYAGTAHFTSTDTNAQTVLPLDATLANGIGTFSATLTLAGSRTISAADTATAAITGTSNTIAVSAAGATHFAIAAPANAAAGTSFSVSVTAQDAFDNIAASYSGTVHFTSSDTNAQTVMPADSTLASGVGVFNATLTQAGNQTITATDTVTATTTGTSGTIAVNAVAATHLVISAPATVNEGDTFSATVTAKDQFNNNDLAYAGSVHFTSSDAKAVLPADTALVGGTGTFSASIKKTGAQTLSATDTVNNAVTGSASIQVDNVAPVVTIGGVPAQVETGSTISLSALVADPGADDDTFTYAWTVTRNGATFATGTAADISFIPDLEAAYVCSVTVTDSDGATGSASVTIQVDTSVQFLSGPSYSPNPATVSLTTTFSVVTKPADAAVTWDFGDGSPLETGLSVQHIYVAAGNYTAKVTARNPRSGTTATTTLAVQVTEGSVLPGTSATLFTRGIIRLGPNFDRVTITSVMQLLPGQTVANQPLTIKINGLTRTFMLDGHGNATTAEARVHLRIYRFTSQGPLAKLTLNLRGALKTELSTDVARDARGLPMKAALTIAPGAPGSSVYSSVAPLNFKASTARFGFGR